MNILVENKVELTREIFMEWRISGRTESYKKTIRNFTVFMVLFLIGSQAVFYLMGMAPFMMMVEAGLFIAVYIWLVFGLPRSRNKNQYKAICRYADGAPERIARFYEDNFTVTTESGEERLFFYNKVQEIRETENLYVMIIDEADVDVLLDKNGFRKGSIEQVKQLCQAEND